MMTMSCPSIPQRRKMDCVSTVVDQDQVEPSAHCSDLSDFLAGGTGTAEM